MKTLFFTNYYFTLIFRDGKLDTFIPTFCVMRNRKETQQKEQETRRFNARYMHTSFDKIHNLDFADEAGVLLAKNIDKRPSL